MLFSSLISSSFDNDDSIFKSFKSSLLFNLFLDDALIILFSFLLLYMEKLLLFTSIEFSLYSESFKADVFSSFDILILSKHSILFVFIKMQER